MSDGENVFRLDLHSTIFCSLVNHFNHGGATDRKLDDQPGKGLVLDANVFQNVLDHFTVRVAIQVTLVVQRMGRRKEPGLSQNSENYFTKKMIKQYLSSN